MSGSDDCGGVLWFFLGLIILIIRNLWVGVVRVVVTESVTGNSVDRVRV